MMPEVDGFEVLEMLRKVPRTARIPVLALTAKQLSPDDWRRLRHGRIAQLIIKGGLDRVELVAAVDQLCRSGAWDILGRFRGGAEDVQESLPNRCSRSDSSLDCMTK
jgi:CheY-like chemotaxis protein